ncbi:MAG TPA: lytic transglycosylase domain-containing protein, partial [bacterium]|nr:lytic transglycosylase domain-containing protein [bacterium]
TIYYRAMLLRTYVARRRYNQALEMMDIIKSEYPVYYIGSALECVKADIALFRKHYDNALTIYDRCLQLSSSDIASYNRILALERGGKPLNGFLKDYLDFAESYESSFLIREILDRLVYLKEKNNFPTSASLFYGRWLNIMTKHSRLDGFFSPEFLQLSHPVSLQVISYLTGKNRYHDALKVIDDNLKLFEKKEDNLYIYTIEKYRLLVEKGDVREAADYMIKASENFSGNRSDRLKFFAGFYYFQVGENEKAKNVLKELIFDENRGRYFLLALYRLGLIYITEGSDLYTFSLWSNYISDPVFSGSRFIGGQRTVNAMYEITSLIDRLNNFNFFSSDINFECLSTDVSGISGNNRFISYYDFVYAHLIGREEFKNSLPTDFPVVLKKWDDNRLDKTIDAGVFLENFKKLSKRAKTFEHIRMTELFFEAGIRSGVSFYFDLMERILRFDDSKIQSLLEDTGIIVPDKDQMYGIILSIREFRNIFQRKMYLYLGRVADLVDMSFANIGQELTFSPHYGMENEWKTLYPVPYFNEISRLSKEFSIPPQLIYSIMRAETFYRENLVSRVGALGLMQVMPATFEKIQKFGGIKINNPFDPYESMKASAWYLSKLLARFDGNLILAVAAYNAGPHNVSKWLDRFKGFDSYVFIELIPFYETRDYVKKVLRYFEIYSYLYEGKFYDLKLKEPLIVEEIPDIV